MWFCCLSFCAPDALADTGKPAPSAGSKSKARKGAAEAEASQDEPGCIVRAVLKKRKISTVIQAKDQVKFQMMFSNILKVKLEGLKKRAGKRESKKKKKSSTRRKGGARD